jgi:integrase
VQDWINTLSAKGLAPNTIRQIYRAVFKAIIALALDDELIARTPCRRIELRTATKAELHPLTPEQVMAMAAAVRPRYRAMVILAACTGMRWSEIAGLTLDRIDWRTRTVTVDRQLKRNATTPIFTPPKSKAGIRTLPLPTLAVAELLLHPLAVPARARRAAVHHPGRHGPEPEQLAAPGMEPRPQLGLRRAA